MPPDDLLLLEFPELDVFVLVIRLEPLVDEANEDDVPSVKELLIPALFIVSCTDSVASDLVPVSIPITDATPLNIPPKKFFTSNIGA